jgi:hypothetical protein
MKFDVFTEMQYTANTPGTLILNIHALRTPNQTVIKEAFTIEPTMLRLTIAIPSTIIRKRKNQ